MYLSLVPMLRLRTPWHPYTPRRISLPSFCGSALSLSSSDTDDDELWDPLPPQRASRLHLPSLRRPGPLSGPAPRHRDHGSARPYPRLRSLAYFGRRFKWAGMDPAATSGDPLAMSWLGRAQSRPISFTGRSMALPPLLDILRAFPTIANLHVSLSRCRAAMTMNASVPPDGHLGVTGAAHASRRTHDMPIPPMLSLICRSGCGLILTHLSLPSPGASPQLLQLLRVTPALIRLDIHEWRSGNPPCARSFYHLLLRDILPKLESFNFETVQVFSLQDFSLLARVSRLRLVASGGTLRDVCVKLQCGPPLSTGDDLDLPPEETLAELTELVESGLGLKLITANGIEWP
ncbi:hypothetical protein C8R47DRAFT_1321895 [Mycena vitilis]|nr:hypothetical protein C8R47DRAFT_1321895 [Mycena vitilis]